MCAMPSGSWGTFLLVFVTLALCDGEGRRKKKTQPQSQWQCRGFTSTVSHNNIPTSTAYKSVLTNIFVFKMPKAGSKSFLKNFVSLNCNAKEPAHIEWSENCAGQGPLYVTLREPTAHVISMYNHCQHGQGMGIHHYDRVSLKEWLTAWASADRATAGKLLRETCGYSPRNFQTSRLDGAACAGKRKRVPTLAGARHALRAAKFVGVTHWMDASVCVAHFKLHGSLPATCNDLCSISAKHLSKDTHGINHTVIDSLPIDASTLALIWGLTRADQIIYADAVGRFVQDARAIEQAAGARLLCADVEGSVPVDRFINTATHLA